ncbi:hypothetical protein HS041_25585 [Planomonospora sp. ID67723]|uniref:hypothetical protein n=1 Tax=Planomonospora sp. ID67723 TaxID=2738134 RepID=UPI0018C43180|nr:hypothetical protein [Planomonospora sp. ID67723]MBG0831137.1 hypothetical protein [Planomonospora sp. ID67723]
MALKDWAIIDSGRVATRAVNGTTVTVMCGTFPSLEAAVKDWESREAARLAHDLQELGRLVDGALDRLKHSRVGVSHHEPICTGDLR